MAGLGRHYLGATFLLHSSFLQEEVSHSLLLLWQASTLHSWGLLEGSSPFPTCCFAEVKQELGGKLTCTLVQHHCNPSSVLRGGCWWGARVKIMTFSVTDLWALLFCTGQGRCCWRCPPCPSAWLNFNSQKCCIWHSYILLYTYIHLHTLWIE